MELKELKEMHDKERERCQKILDKSISNLRTDKTFFVDVFPEFQTSNKDRTYTNALESDITIQFPFYDKIILPIPSFRSPKIFSWFINFSVEEILHLCKRGKIIPVLARIPQDYAGLDYLDPIIDFIEKNNLPTSLEQRKTILCNTRMYLMNYPMEEYVIWSEFAKNMVRDTDLKKLGRLYRIGELVHVYPFTRLESVGMLYAELCSFGYIKLANRLLSKDPASIMAGLGVYNYVLETSSLFSNGIPSYDSVILDLIVENLGAGENLHFKKLLEKAFPVDVGKLLTDKFELVAWKPKRKNPEKVDYVLEVIKDTKSARRALFEINKRVKHLEIEKSLERITSLDLVFKEIEDSLQRNVIGRRKNYVRYLTDIALGASGLGLSSLISELVLRIGIIGSLMGLGKLPPIDTLAEKTAKQFSPPHLVAIFDLKKSVMTRGRYRL